MAINSDVIRFVAALVIAGIVLEIIGTVSQKAAWIIALLIILGMFLTNDTLNGWLGLGTSALGKGLKK